MRLNAFAVALLLATNSLVWASEDILNRADALIRLQSPEQAYELLAPLEDELAGTPQFDYLLGLSLLEQNKPQNAIFAFERCLTVEPTNGPCRVQMARTHLALGEASNARAEFEIINEYNPPAEI
ncbi:MAG TPA: tetratricopeptide repeat protein, partial [Agitococcus sp.]|nr:tetratricopeptide repeat protein [Agitococcus sp.]